MEGVTMSITKHLFSNQKKKKENKVFSPLSLFTVLSIIAAGSAGRTLQELLSFLQFDSVDHLTTFFSHLVSVVPPSSSSSSSKAASSRPLSFANGIWIDESISLRDSFKQLMETHYKATLNSADFQKGAQVCREVNTWVEKETNGHIKVLLPPQVSKLTGLIFANALHFKGPWKKKFDASRTRDDDFHLLNGTSVKVPFMRRGMEYEFWSINTFDDFKVLRLFYQQGRREKCQFSMDIYLPNAKNGLRALIEKLASKPEFLKDKKFLPQREVEARVKIPKFKFSFAFEASQVLKELGVVLPFILGAADFTKMAEKAKLLSVESIFHKAFIEVNEEETEAAAATAAVMVKGKTICSSRIDFVANHPFLFLVRENYTGTILFVGQVLDPLNGKATPVKEDSRKRKRV